MQKLLSSRAVHIGVAAVLILVAGGLLVRAVRPAEVPMVTATVERGDVVQLVSISGVVEAEDLANLAFPVSGIVREVRVREGDHVEAGDVLITLEDDSLQADRQAAAAQLAAARADRDELVAGPRAEAREVTSAEVLQAEQNLARITNDEAEKVKNARRALLSTGLTASANDPTEDAIPPTVSGTYSCDEEGEYFISLYRSNSSSGYSYRVRGLETGTYEAFDNQSSGFGTCGLRLQLSPASTYSTSGWTIAVPNTNAATYVTLKNTYDLARETASSAVAAATDALTVARRQATLTNAAPRTEALTRANAAVSEAAARLARIDAELQDRVLTAPFAGTVIDLDILPGETVTTAPVVGLIADSAFALTARIPEIDVTTVAVGQTANLLFDAKADTPLEGLVTFISPSATEIDGVAYYEATIMITEPPAWLRSGLNADVDIVVATASDVLRVPKRFVSETAGVFSVRTPLSTGLATTTIDIGLVGNDGYIEIIGLNEGDTIVAP